MNCRDIACVIDSSTICPPDSPEFRACEEHAYSCRQCAELWFAHARLFVESIPPMPPELSVRCLTVAASGAGYTAARHSSRRIMFAMGGLVVLAAAASMLLVNVANAPAPQRDDVVDFTTTASTTAVPLPQEIPPPEAAVLEVADVLPQPTNSLQGPVPRVPTPVDADKAFIARQKLALEKLVELHSELVQGPPTEDMFVAAIILRDDGTVLKHAVQTATRESSRKVSDEMRKLMPVDGGETIGDFARKGTQVADGRALRGDLAYQHLSVSSKYDPSRSNLRVDEILRADHAALMLPIGNAGVNYVTVLLSDKGAVQKEIVELVTKEELQQRALLGVAERAKEMARRLGVVVDQIGLMGYAPITDADSGRVMYVDYAWQRRAGEAAPTFRQGGNTLDEEGIDAVAALALVERVMPDAFMGDAVERSLGQAVIVLTRDGQVIRTGRRKPGKDADGQMQNLVRGAPIGSARTLILTNSKGETAAVYFVWPASP